MMAKKFDEYHFLILLLVEIEEGKHNDFNFDEQFLKNLQLKYKKLTNGEFKKIILKCETHKWIEQRGMGKDCPYKITERGKGVAVSKRKEFNENFGKKLNKFIGDYKNIFYVIGFFVTLILAYIKIKG